MIFAEWAILLLGSLKVRALCAIYLASQINAERCLWMEASKYTASSQTTFLLLNCLCFGGRREEERLVGLTCKICS